MSHDKALYKSTYTLLLLYVYFTSSTEVTRLLGFVFVVDGFSLNLLMEVCIGTSVRDLAGYGYPRVIN